MIANVGYFSDIISIHYNEVLIGLALLPITLFTAITQKCIRAIPNMMTKHKFVNKLVNSVIKQDTI